MSFHKIRNLLLFAILLCAVRATFANDQRLVCGRRRVKVEYLLQHGTDAKAGHWPWHAAIFHRKANFEYACGGSILDQNTILTAAHCVSTAHGVLHRNRISVHVGRLHLNMENEYTQTLEVAELIVYPGFTVHGVVNDIALIKLTTNITMSVYVQPVCLWNMDDRQESIIGHNGTIVGFGLTEEDVVSEQLKQAFVCVGDPVECLATDRSVYGSHLTKEMFCGKGQEGVSACNGDSGGGMFFKVDARWFIRGVVSFIPGRQNNSNLCDGSKSTVFTDVAKYLTWIKEHIDQRAIVDHADDFAVDYEEKLKLFDFDTCGNYEKGSDIDWVGGLIYETPYGRPKLSCMFTWISKSYAVGPAHCYPKDGARMTIQRPFMLNSNLRSTAQIKRIFIHPKYNDTSYENDISLIELSNPDRYAEVTAVCLPIKPERNTSSFENLVTPAYNNDMVITNVSYRNHANCVRSYAQAGIHISLSDKNFCVELKNASGTEEACNPLPAGAPIATAAWHGGEPHFVLRGFNIFDQTCDSSKPLVNINITQYMDWILYNMRNQLDDDVKDVSDLDSFYESILAEEKEDKEEEMFEEKHCGLATLDQRYDRLADIPWIGRLHTNKTIRADELRLNNGAILISKRHALAAAEIMDNKEQWRFFTIGSVGEYLLCTQNDCKDLIKVARVKQVTVHPNFTRYPRRNDIAVIEFRHPLQINRNSKVNPICLPMTQSLHNSNPLSLSMSSYNFIFSETRKLKQLDAASCQTRFVQHGYLINYENIPLCAIHSDNERQKFVQVVSGASLQVLLKFKGKNRYFLKGMQHPFQYNASNSNIENVLLPYLFTDIHSQIGWIVETIKSQTNNTATSYRNLYSSPSELGIGVDEAEDDQVNLSPLRNIAKRRMFDFETCGMDAHRNISDQYSKQTFPWYAHSNDNCIVTLISEWYVVGGAFCLQHDTKEIKFGSGESEFTIPVEKTFVHPLLDRTREKIKSISLIQLAMAVTFNERGIRPVCLPLTDGVRASGYKRSNLITIGELNENEFLAAKAGDRSTELKRCEKTLKRYLLNGTMCIYTPPMKPGETYDERQGSPIITIEKLNESDKYFLRGLSLYGVNNAFYNSKLAISYIEIEDYLDWILDNMNETLHRTTQVFDLTEMLIFGD